jgi:hypothetical protein
MMSINPNTTLEMIELNESARGKGRCIDLPHLLSAFKRAPEA